MPNEANTPFSTLKVAEDVHLCAFELPTFSHFLHQVLVPFGHHATSRHQVLGRPGKQGSIKQKWPVIREIHGHALLMFVDMGIQSPDSGM